MTKKSENAFVVSNDFNTTTNDLKSAMVSVKSLLPEMVGEEKKSDFSTQALLVAFTDVVFFTAKKPANKGVIPSADTCKADFKSWVQESTDDKSIQARLQRRCEFVIQGSLLCHAKSDAFTIGYHLKDDKNFVSPDARVGKPASFADRYAQSLFWNKSAVFEYEMLDSKTKVKSRSDWVIPTQAEVADSFKLIFGNAHLNENKTGLLKETRVKDSEKMFSLEGEKEQLKTIKAVQSLIEEYAITGGASDKINKQLQAMLDSGDDYLKNLGNDDAERLVA